MKYKEIIILVVIFLIMLLLLVLGDSSSNSNLDVSFEEIVVLSNESETIKIGELTLTNNGILPIEPNLPNYIVCSSNQIGERIIFGRGNMNYNRNIYLNKKESKTFEMYVYNYPLTSSKILQDTTREELFIYEEDTWDCYDLQTEHIARIKIENE